MISETEKYYQNRLEQLEIIEVDLKKNLKWLAFGRLFTFVILFVSIFAILPTNTGFGIFLLASFLILFLKLIKTYRNKNDQHRHIRALIDICQSEIKALNHEYSGFAAGSEFDDHNHPFSYDMDLFGEGSLFQYINRTVTFKGKQYLASWLKEENLDPDSINNKQEAVKELITKVNQTQDFRGVGSHSKDDENDLNLLKEWIEKPVFYMNRKRWHFMIYALPILTILCAVGAIFIAGLINLFIVLYLTQFLIIGSRIRHTSAEHSLIGKRLDALRKYYELVSCIEKEKYSSKDLRVIYEKLFTDQYSAANSIKKLTKIVASFDARLNMVAAMFLEGVLLWDIRCMIQLEKWKTREGRHLHDWIDAIAKFDAYVSLSNFAFNHPENCFPVCSESKILDTKGLGHVLIPGKQRITNDFSIDSSGQFIIITGANMAGKSTFLRTVATNLILAMTGAPVCASEFSFKPMKIFSSMRTSDSLNKNESYFYAELKRLKEMLDKLHAGENIFIILDEILKGTNSIDKQKGSKALLEQIIKLQGTGIIATHDLELTKTVEKYPDLIRNMCFEIEIDNAAISFDYKIREGVTTKMNASLLMQQMGIGIED